MHTIESTSKSHRRVLIFVVAYNAQDHVVSTFERIPKHLFNNDHVHVLCIDDASSDATSTNLARWCHQNAIDNVTILRNPINQGYGGNQKLGYRLALDQGYDFVILLHGDGQYAPELLSDLIDTWEKTGADVVLGSRMQDVRDARKGGMPLYKIVGNRILTKIQNRLCGQSLSEYHTGYRGYACSYLRKVPFEANTNDFHFDTEILLQANYLGAKIVEIPIPTRYGDEVCHVNGLRYALDVLASTIRYRLHAMGMMCSIKYRNLEPIRYQDKTRMVYTSHAMALQHIARVSPKTVLDIGCGPGFVASRCEALGATVTGVDSHDPLPAQMTEFHKADLEKENLPVDPFNYEMILMLDVIEHLEEPEEFLINLRNRGRKVVTDKSGPLVLISTPNIAFIGCRINLLLGRFNYATRGILDITHKRLFTRSALLQCLRDCVYDIEKVQGVPPPFETVMGGWIGRWLNNIFGVATKLWPQMFAFQHMVLCRPRPCIHQLLASAEQHLPTTPEPDPTRTPVAETSRQEGM